MSDSPSPPPPPDYVGAAQAQGAANVEAARASAKLSNPNIISPYGKQTVQYGLGGDQDVPTVTQTLSPESQQVLDSQNKTKIGLSSLAQQGIGTAQNVLGTPFSFGGPNVQTSLDTSGIAKMPVNAGMTAQDAIMSRLEPLQERQRVSQETRLTNQGLRPGDEAWDNGMRDFTQGQNDLKTQAALQGIGVDMNANNQGFNQAVQSGQFGNTAQQQALAQALQNRQIPLNEITALMSGSQIQNPQFMGYSGQNIGAAPIMAGTQAQGNSLMNAFNQQQAAANANNASATAAGTTIGSGIMSAALYSGYF